MFTFLFLRELWEKHVTGKQSKWYLRALFSPLPRNFILKNQNDPAQHLLAFLGACFVPFGWPIVEEALGGSLNLWYPFALFIFMGMVFMILKPPPNKIATEFSAANKDEDVILFWGIYWAIELGFLLGMFAVPFLIF